ncbi:nuclear cap-binding protein, putative [Plasmodium knowlesi strain H]|uniref:Nuclear cap-binding protein subunit 2 n=3 Tax=Plasmodium knowlesi TaxID=5850 RepID=A0A5K1UQQ3_PLAKH|nr:nuclear cap-binding protein subunit 2, putative [Plasmodium knowlesi strain H]OTN67998.1 putative Nuclear cap-binding protein [Plasmodium knowlesi]CAA9986958.1 nuclear cap-binding protein subunit 2, putative [Plasmodium knowlesi strain H]SBO26451.1 nuclear cap-binding protein, putative [Plasmodium knowlesi strain H]SBO28162.1 nuclear cap-binding protein, putative [Plasmodium knowlesi strain H]VVS76432.1 nuclear cap-binding protein subunit 2, putative [Plasmodium knowlesi strain H]|eukprot:XP_002258205.1 nuclear cap-binding protein, putative [Plasmodium knowlesi strain H]
MSHLYEEVYKKRKYYDRALCNDYEDWLSKIQFSKTVYIGNLSIYTTEQQIYEHMRQAGNVENIIMGLHRTEKSPCGFCFVVYRSKEGYTQAVNFLNNSILDGRIIRVDEDLGIIGRRKYGRGKSGVQKRDERIKYYDEDRPQVLDHLVDNNFISKKRKLNNVDVIAPPYYERNVKQRTTLYNSFEQSGDFRGNRFVQLKPTVTLYPNVQHMMEYNRNKHSNGLYNFHSKRGGKRRM